MKWWKLWNENTSLMEINESFPLNENKISEWMNVLSEDYRLEKEESNSKNIIFVFFLTKKS